MVGEKKMDQFLFKGIRRQEKPAAKPNSALRAEALGFLHLEERIG